MLAIMKRTFKMNKMETFNEATAHSQTRIDRAQNWWTLAVWSVWFRISCFGVCLLSSSGKLLVILRLARSAARPIHNLLFHSHLFRRKSIGIYCIPVALVSATLFLPNPIWQRVCARAYTTTIFGTDRSLHISIRLCERKWICIK